MPRDPRLWVFGAQDGRGHAGNTRYLAGYVKAHHPEIRVVWLAASREVCRRVRALGLECHGRFSLKGFALAARAGVFFVTHHLFDVNPYVSGGGGGGSDLARDPA